MDVEKRIDMGHNLYGRSEKSNNFYTNYAFLLTVAACLAGTIGNNMLMLGITAMFALLIIKPEYLLGPILFFTIFDEFLLVASNASVSRFLTMFFIIAIAIPVLRRGTIKRESLIFIVLIVLSVVLSIYSALGYTSLPISYILNVLLAIAMVNHSVTNAQEIPKLLYSYAVLALVYVYFLLARNGFGALVEGTRISISDSVNSNQLAMGLAIVMVLLVSDLLLFKERAVVDALLIAANCVALFLSGSRTALIAAIVAAFLLYIINAQDKRSKRKAFFLLLFSITALLLIYTLLQKYFPLLMRRFTIDSVKDSGGTGRTDIWESFFTHLFPKYWLFGMGFDPLNFIYAIGELRGRAKGAHNILVDMLSRTGIIGTALYLACFARYFRAMLQKLRMNKFLLASISIVLTIIINGLGENVLGTRFLWFGIGLGYMLIYSCKEENEKS